jgi:trk system potassium uptake protein TrkA
VAGRRIDEIGLPAGAQIGAIVRARDDAQDSSEVIIAHHDTQIRTGDHVVVFVPRKRMVRDIEKLFQVSAVFGF